MGQIMKLLASMMLLLLAGTAHAGADMATPSTVEKHLMGKGIKIVKAFPAIGGMKAIVADNGKEQRLFYVTPDGQALLSGIVFDASGNNVTDKDLGRASIQSVHAPEVSAGGALDQVWSRAEKLSWIAEGALKPKKTIYVFFDANCPYCHSLWTQLRTAVSEGAIQIRWLPVAILRDSSKGLAASIYESDKPTFALGQMVNRQLKPSFVSDAVNRRISHNLLALRDTGYTGVPVILAKGDDGRVTASMGLPTPQQLTALFK